MPPGVPLVTARHDGRMLVVAGASPAAAAIGLHPGLAIGEAQARVPGLAVRPADPDGDHAALRRLARLCLRYAPLTAADPPDGVLVDATGCAHLFGGERRMLRSIVETAAGLGLAARAAIAGTAGAAHAVARHGATGTDRVAVVPPGDEADAIAALPPEALRLPDGLAATLRRLGLATVADLRRLPRAQVARRYGADLVRRLDQATGHADEPIGPEPPVRPAASRLGFVEPLLTAEAFGAAAGRLLDEVCHRLDAGRLGARRLELRFERVDGTQTALRLATSAPVRDPARLARLLAERLPTVDPGCGVEAMRLVVRRAEPLDPRQGEAPFGGAPDAAALAPLLDTLVNRLGVHRVWRPAPVESDVPERAVRRVPFLSPDGAGGNRSDDAAGARPRGASGIWSHDASGIWSHDASGTWPHDASGIWPDAAGRPVRLIDPPQPVNVMALLPDHPPASFVWRRVRHVVRHADGPERIAGEWWRRAGEVRAVRDYFRVEDEDGRRFWLFRRGDGRDPETGDMRWFVHGVF